MYINGECEFVAKIGCSGSLEVWGTVLASIVWMNESSTHREESERKQHLMLNTTAGERKTMGLREVQKHPS